MKFRKKLTPQVRSRLRSVLMVAAMLLLNTLSAFAQAGGGFNSTDLKTGISNSLAVIMMFGFVLGISAVIYGGFAIRRGDVDQGKMSIIGGAIVPAIMGYISDVSSIQKAFIVPLICYLYILYFAVAGYKHSGASSIRPAVEAQRA